MSILNRLRKTEDKKAAKGATAAKKADKKVAKLSTSSEKSAKAIANHTTLLRPVVTEKATVNGTYIFEVPLEITKNEVAKAVERLFGVKPLHVRTMRVEGKSVRAVHRMGKRKDWKKAIVRLPHGKTINVYEGV